MDIQQLRIFVEVVQQGSFAGAARRLDLAPSVVTRSVAALEAELGVRLMQRTTRKLSLTSAGAAYCEQVLEVLQRLDQAGEEARASTAETRGTVRLTTSVAYGQTVVVPMLPRLHARHPGLEIDLLLTDAVVDIVAHGIDLALRLGPPTDSSLVGSQLTPMRYHAVASPDYLARHDRPREPADLAARDCLRFALPGFRTSWSFRDAAGRTQVVGVKGWLVLSTALALHRAALDGLGPALLPDWLVRGDLQSGGLIDLFPGVEGTATNFDSAVWLLHASRNHVPRRVRAVVDFLKAEASVGAP
jgi:DNA-binding transcriptional LysR family regulator